MDDDIYSFALKSTLSEIPKICSDVKNSFIFKDDGDVVAGDEKTSEQTIVKFIDSFEDMIDKADAIGGFEGMTLECANGQVNLSCVNGMYLVMVASKNADKRYLNTVTKVLIPTVLKLLERINPATLKDAQPQTDEELLPTAEEPEEPEEASNKKSFVQEKETLFEHVKQFPPEPPVNQFIVGNLGGLLVPADTVRIDDTLLSQWQQLYEDSKIEKVEIETFGGQSTQCKVRSIKDSKFEGKGVIQMPDKIQNTLEVKKGELVRVKPLIE